MHRVLTILLAGGAGERLAPLTQDEPKPMMPFGGIYRLIDVTLSNCVNSGLTRVLVVTQHKALSLNRHIREAWNILSPELGQYIEAVPPTRRNRDTWYLGTADAVYQNIQSIEEENTAYTLIVSADHIYKMNYMHMVAWHEQLHADVTVATVRVGVDEACRFGIVDTDASSVITGFEEKPQHGQPSRSAFRADACNASMGIYLFRTEVLLDALRDDAMNEASAHDFGKDVLPRLVGRQRLVAYDFVDENRDNVRYWRDVGTLDAYYDANMDLVAVTPVFNLYDPDWPIRTAPTKLPPAKFVFAQEGERIGFALDSLVSHGCIISGAHVVRSVLSPGVRVHSHSTVDSSVLFPNVQIGRHSQIRRAIVDQDITIAESSQIGVDHDADLRAGHFITNSGLVIVHRGSPGVEYSTPNRQVLRRSVASA